MRAAECPYQLAGFIGGDYIVFGGIHIDRGVKPADHDVTNPDMDHICLECKEKLCKRGYDAGCSNLQHDRRNALKLATQRCVGTAAAFPSWVRAQHL